MAAELLVLPGTTVEPHLTRLEAVLGEMLQKEAFESDFTHIELPEAIRPVKLPHFNARLSTGKTHDVNDLLVLRLLIALLITQGLGHLLDERPTIDPSAGPYRDLEDWNNSGHA